MSGTRCYSFGPYTLDPTRRLLLRGQEPIPVTARAFDVLFALVTRAGETVTKEELLRSVWPDTIVEDANLSQQVFTIRKLLGLSDQQPYIATVPRRGYRFIADVREGPPSAPAQVAPAFRHVLDAPVRLGVPLEGLMLPLGPSSALAIAPDGSALVFVASTDHGVRLFLRSLREFSVREIPGTQGAANPFFSPDGEWVGFSAGRTLQKVALAGGPPVHLCDVADVRGAAWSRDGIIVFAPGPTSGLWQVDEGGGTARPLTTLDYDGGERTHRWPHVVSDGRGVIFTVGHAGATTFDEASLAVAELGEGTHRLIVRHGSDGRYVETGHLVWGRGGVLLAARFNLGERRLASASRPVHSGVAMAATGVVHATVSSNGTLVHVPGQAETLRRELVTVDRDGRIAAHYASGEALEEPRASRDGQCVVVSLRGRTSDLWLFEFPRGALRRVTFEGENFAGIWGPAGHQLTYSSSRLGGPSDLYVLAPDRADVPALLVASEFDKVASSWTADGSVLLFTEYHPDTGSDIWMLERASERVTPFVRTPFNEYTPALSPDGRYVAYTTDESGRPEIHLVTFPEATGKRQLSTDGGAEPMWSPDGHELFYRSGDRLMRVDMSRGPEDAGVPTTLFEGRFERGTVTLANYDVVENGSRFLMVRAEDLRPPHSLLVTLGWFRDLDVVQ